MFYNIPVNKHSDMFITAIKCLWRSTGIYYLKVNLFRATVPVSIDLQFYNISLRAPVRRIPSAIP